MPRTETFHWDTSSSYPPQAAVQSNDSRTAAEQAQSLVLVEAVQMVGMVQEVAAARETEGVEGVAA